ncbi:MAG: hypothetical protein KC503_37175 [Myxococcales bacterium]|nr:hypothetical protein [Myxococcales bacterium]
MTDPITKRDALDEQLSHHLGRSLRRIQLGSKLPQPTDAEPTDDQLLRLLDGQLADSERRELETLVGASDFSKDRFEILREALDEFAELDESAAEADSRVRLSPDDDKPSSFARLVFALRKGADQVLDFLRGTDMPLMMAPAAVAVRGAAAAAAEEPQHFYKFERSFGEWDALIQIESVPERGVEIRLELSRDGVALKDARVSLRRRGKLLESVRMRDGVAGFRDLSPDHYSVTVTRHDSEIGQLTLDFLQ